MTSCCGAKVVFRDNAEPEDIGPRLEFTHVECGCGAESRDGNLDVEWASGDPLPVGDPAWSKRDDGTYVFTASCGKVEPEIDRIARAAVDDPEAWPDGQGIAQAIEVLGNGLATAHWYETTYLAFLEDPKHLKILDQLSALAYNKWHFTQVPKWVKDRPHPRPVTRVKLGAPALSRYYSVFDYDLAAQGVICCICDRTTGDVLVEARAEREELETANEKHDLAESRAWALFQQAELVQEIEPGPAALIRALAVDPDAMQRFNEFSPAGEEEYAC